MLLLAPASVATVNIDGNTIYSGMGLNCKVYFCPLNDLQIVSLRNKLSEVRIIIIDEISMASKKLFI